MASESEYDFPVEEQIRMALQRLPYPAQLEALGATYEYNAPEDVQIQMFLERARADCAAMAAKSGEDVEQYTQRMMKSFIARLKKRCCPETSEKQSGVSDEASGVDAFYGQRQSPRPAAVCLPPKHDEISSSSLQTDVLQPDPHQNTEGQVQEDTNILLEGSHQLTARSSPAHATGENSELKQKETIASEDSGLGTNAPMTALGKDGAMRDASKAAPEMPLTTNEGAVGSDMALADASTKASSTSLNPWSRFAKAPDVGGFTKKTLSNPPTHINRRSSTGEATCNVFAKMYRQRSRPDHLNEHVVNNQRSAIMRTPYRSNDEDALDFPTTCPTRHLGNSSAHSLKDARLTSLVDKAEKGNDLAIGEKEFFGGLHPSRLGQISNQGESEPAACYSQSHDNKAEKVGRSKTYILTSANGQQTTSTTRDKERTYNQTAEKVKGPRLKTKGNAGTALNLEPRFKGLSNNTVQLFIDAVENLKKRYAHLRLISNGDKKDWVFAWQEITAIFRTSSNYNYIPCRGGFKLQLHTDFKVFSLRGPFETKATGKDIITRKAVLHVLDGPYFFRQAVPALEGMCLTLPLSLSFNSCTC